MFRVARLRKTLGPLSAGTPVEVLGEVGSHGYVAIKLLSVSKALREQIRHHKVYAQLLGPFDVEADMIVFARIKSVPASAKPFKEAS